MKRPTSSGVYGVLIILLLGSSIFLFQPIRHKIILYCKRNTVSIKPKILGGFTQIGGQRSDICVLEGRYPIQDNGPLPQVVAPINCSELPKPMELGIWGHVSSTEKIEIHGWDKNNQPTDFELGYFYNEYRLINK